MIPTKQWPRLCLAVLACSGLLACGAEESASVDGPTMNTARIEGTVFYRERMMLPPGVEVEVQLQDISRPDAMATVLESAALSEPANYPGHRGHLVAQPTEMTHIAAPHRKSGRCHTRPAHTYTQSK